MPANFIRTTRFHFKSNLYFILEKCITTESGGGKRDGMFDDIIYKECTGVDIKKVVLGSTINSVQRYGKYMWLVFPNSHLLLHFGMTGSLSVDGIERPDFKEFTVSADWPPKVN